MFGMIFLFLFAIVLVIVVMSVANTMGMVVLERTREIGTLRSLGMKRRSVLALFSVEGALLALTGCLAGIIVCVLLAAAVNVANITYVPPNSSSPIQLQVALSAADLLRSFAFLALLATATALWPARRAARMEIVDAFGHV
jgi:putative ABC transport system permease protein